MARVSHRFPTKSRTHAENTTTFCSATKRFSSDVIVNVCEPSARLRARKKGVLGLNHSPCPVEELNGIVPCGAPSRVTENAPHDGHATPSAKCQQREGRVCDDADRG